MTDLFIVSIYGVVLPAPLLDHVKHDDAELLLAIDGLTDDRSLLPLLSTSRETYERILQNRSLERIARQGTTRERAVLRRYLREELVAAASAARSAYGRGDNTALVRAISRLREAYEAYIKLYPQQPRLGAAEARKPRRETRGKGRDNLAGLPPDWDIMLLRAAPSDDRLWLATVNLGGPRCGVLADIGISLRTVEDTLQLHVPASKGAAAPPPLIYDRRHPVADGLAAYVAEHGGEICVRDGYNRIKKRHARLTESVLGCALPPSIHRHQLHADLKAAGWDADAIRQITGKQSAKSITVYGTASQGRSRRGVCLRLGPACEATPQPASPNQGKPHSTADQPQRLKPTTKV